MKTPILKCIYLLIFTGVLIISQGSCKKEKEEENNNNNSPTPLKPLAVGDNYQGGKVAYFFQSGDAGYVAGEVHGLIVSSTNLGTGAEWGCYQTEIGGTSTNFGTGQTNTTTIVSGCATQGIAAKLCNDLTLDGYSDWYLPSMAELIKIYQNKTAIGGFDGMYWSSSEANAASAWCIEFYYGSQHNSNKYNTNKIRPVRRF